MSIYPSLTSLLNEDFGKNRINEVAGSLAVSAVLSIPAVLDGIARLLKKIGKKHHKEFAAAEGLEKASHKLHNVYQAPIKAIIGGSYRVAHKGKKMDPQKLQKITNIVFAIIVAYLAVSSAMGAGKSLGEIIEHIKHAGNIDKATSLHIGLGILESVLGEMEVKEEVHLIKAITSPEHEDAFSHEIDKHAGSEGHDHEKEGAGAEKKEKVEESLSRGSLYRKRYYGRY